MRLIDIGERPVHSTVLGGDIPIVEHRRGLDALPARGARFYAVAAKTKDFGTFPARTIAA
jgi:arylformamidase